MDESTLHEQMDEFLPRLAQLLGRRIPDAEELAEMTLESKLCAVDAAIRHTIRTKRQPIEANVASDVVSDWLRICEMVLGLNNIRSKTPDLSEQSRQASTSHQSALAAQKQVIQSCELFAISNPAWLNSVRSMLDEFIGRSTEFDEHFHEDVHCIAGQAKVMLDKLVDSHQSDSLFTQLDQEHERLREFARWFTGRYQALKDESGAISVDEVDPQAFTSFANEAFNWQPSLQEGPVRSAQPDVDASSETDDLRWRVPFVGLGIVAIIVRACLYLAGTEVYWTMNVFPLIGVVLILIGLRWPRRINKK